MRGLMIASRGAQVHAHPRTREVPTEAPGRPSRRVSPGFVARGRARFYYSGKLSEVSSTSRSTTAFSSPVSAYVAS